MTRSRRASVRSTPSSLATMTVSDFVRGGLYDIDKPTVVVTHGEPMGMWVPRGQYEAFVGVNGNYYAGSNTFGPVTPPVMAGASIMTMTSSTGAPVVPDNIRSAIAQLNAYLNTDPKEGNDGQEEG